LSLLPSQSSRSLRLQSIMNAGSQQSASIDRGMALHRQGRTAEAEAVYRAVLAHEPNRFEAQYLLAHLKYELGNASEAHALVSRALALNPQSPEAWSLLSGVMFSLGRREDALAACNKALALNPSDPDALHNRGILLIKLARPADALVDFDRALSHRSDFISALFNRANILIELSRHEEALKSYDRVLALAPFHLDTVNNRGNVLVVLGRLGEALASFERVLSLKGDHLNALNNRGIVLKELGRHLEALASFERALVVDPGCVEAMCNRGSVLAILGRHREAGEQIGHALAIAPNHSLALTALENSHAATCQWEGIADLRLRLKAAALRGEVEPFTLLRQDLQPAEFLLCVQNYARKKRPPLSAVDRKSIKRSEKIRLAYLSSDFRKHAIAYLTARLFELHNRARFDLIGISFGPDDNSDIRERLRSSFDQFHDVRAKSDQEIAHLIRDLSVDVAVDLNGFTLGGRPGVLARRPAPIQVSYLGYPGTMGVDYIDYIIADATVVPPEQQSFYSEKVVYLPDTYQANDDHRSISDIVPSRVDVGLPDHSFVFCSFNNSNKITPCMFDLWIRLLQQIEGSVLWLLESNASVPENLRREAQARGVAPDRLVFAPPVKLEDHLARHRLADLFLDTLPYNAHTTASDALWAGLPVITCQGSTFAGRVAASLLTAINLPELITYSLQEYEVLALKLARDPALLVSLKQKLVRNRETTPLFNTEVFARHVEAAYTTMWDRHRRGEPPTSFSVSSIREGSSLRQNSQPTDMDALFRQATARWQDGQVVEAERLFRAVLRTRPNHLGALNLLGILLTQIGQYAQAEALFRSAIEIDARSDATHYNHGIALKHLQRLPEALSAFDRALAINPQAPDTWNNRGTALNDMQRFAEALSAFDKAIALNPEFADTHYNRGNTLSKLERYEEAVSSYDKAIVLDPNRAIAFNNRGNALFALKRFQQAISCYNSALSLEANIKNSRGMRLFAQMQLCDWDGFDDECFQIISALNAGYLPTIPFSLLPTPSSPEEQLKCAQRFIEEQVIRGPQLWRGERYTHDRIRVGYLSSDLRNHAVGSLTVGLFEQHDKSRFEVIAFSSCQDEDSEVRGRMKCAFSQFYDVHHRSDIETAELMRELEIDIVVDLNGLTQSARTGVLALRPAPIQVTYLGYAGTTGADFIDYIIADRVIIPPDQRPFYSERVVYLPYCYQANDDKREISDSAPSRAEAGLPNDGFVFCAFNNSYKINPSIYDVWMRLLREIEGSVLWLAVANPSAMDNLRREAQARGVSPDRLIFAKRAAQNADHLARLRLANLFLDTLPYNAQTTASDALWAGLPVLTCMGATFTSRVAASLLTSVGLPELITHSLSDYEGLALKLARDPTLLQGLREKLAQCRLTTPLFDTTRFSRDIEAAYTTMWKIWRRGESPHAFAVEATGSARL
jgi:predicted O-linked N-acetylglucosamine transferase (SPINDLY family)